MAGLVRGFKGLVYPTSFTVASATATVSIGNPYQIEYTITPSNATNKKINWSSSDTTVATVNNKGVITAVSVGTCTITGVYSYDGTTRTISVTTSQVAVSGVSLDKDTMRIPTRGNGRLHATVYPANASNKNIIWTSSDNSIATVEGGLVKFKKNGNCTITATTEDGGYTDTCAVTCYIPAAGVYLDQDELTITYWTTQSLTATVNPPEADDKSITWSSSDINVATVNNGVITYVANGNCIITCTTVDGGHTATCNIISNNIPVTGVALNKHELTLVPGTPQQLTATISPSNASNKSVTWTSSDTSKATVNNSGVVTYVAAGSCTITCTTVDGGFTDTCEVTCIVPVQSVSLNKTSGTIGSGETIQLVPTINPSNATIKTVTYSSSNTAVATVSSTGLVSYVSGGTATITCTTTQGGKSATCLITCSSDAKVCFLLVGGGGGGSQYYGGGGGAGGVILSSNYTLKKGRYSIVIGTGGSGRGNDDEGIDGGNSTALGFTAYGGGGGGGGNCGPGRNGGSGGGGGYMGVKGGTGCSGQGHNGGGCNSFGSGGGGGAGTSGDNGFNGCLGGYGGQGIQSDIDGTYKRYASGGDGYNGYGCCAYQCTKSWCPALSGNRAGSNATTCGGGGGGVASNTSYGKGANGIFIISYPSTRGYNITGGTSKYLCNGKCIHCFTGNGTLTVS